MNTAVDKRYLIVVLLVSIGITTATHAVARPNGYPGRFSTSTEGCGTCHGTAEPYPEVVVQLASPAKPLTIEAGKHYDFAIVVMHPEAKVAGINIAFTTEATGLDRIGTIDAQADPLLRVTENQIVHRTPHPMNDSVVFEFGWTAPTEPGTYYLQAVSMAGNGDGSDGPDDKWNWMNPVAVTVVPATSVFESNTYSTANSTFQQILTGAEPYTISIATLNGAIVWQQQCNTPCTDWPSKTSLSDGVYAVTLQTRRKRVGVLWAPLH